MDKAATPFATDDRRWRAVLARDPGADGAFVYAVRSTGVFCRPSCPSRRPGRAQVRFFITAAAAVRAGFRPCRRCRPEGDDPKAALVRKVCQFLESCDEGTPTLAAIAARVGVSPHHVQRTFKQALGVSPRDYAAQRRLARFKEEVANGGTIGSALYGAGFGSASRLYEQAGRTLGMTPASYAKGGRGAEIAFAIAESPLGLMLVAATDKGIAMVGFGDSGRALEASLRRQFPHARIERDDRRLKARVEAVLGLLDGRAPRDLALDVRATAFQARVWRLLTAIPPGETRTYGAMARALGRPGAARAVGRACASNPVAVVVPCHRAVGGDGSLTGYRWGLQRKKALLAREQRLDSVDEDGAPRRRAAR
jgi:AraC family transcriptional regulator of adaptative response/methylated-DNA-[protein]-cysteine methyltransferase